MMRNTVKLTIGAMAGLSRITATGLTPVAAMELAESQVGRVVLHLVSAWRDHRFAWHWHGITREFAQA